MTPFLTRLRALDGAASKAPWSILGGPEDYCVFLEGVRYQGYDGEMGRPDVALIVALRNAAPRIAAALERGRALLDALYGGGVRAAMVAFAAALADLDKEEA